MADKKKPTTKNAVALVRFFSKSFCVLNNLAWPPILPSPSPLAECSKIQMIAANAVNSSTISKNIFILIVYHSLFYLIFLVFKEALDSFCQVWVFLDV